MPARLFLSGSMLHLRFLLCPLSLNLNTSIYPAKRTPQKHLLGAVGLLPVLVQEGPSGDHQSGLRLGDECSHSGQGTPRGAGVYYVLNFLSWSLLPRPAFEWRV